MVKLARWIRERVYAVIVFGLFFIVMLFGRYEEDDNDDITR